MRAIRQLSTTLEDEKLNLNKRLRAESAAMLGHALCNLALIQKALGRDGFDKIEEAERILDAAWEDAGEHSQIQCEVGLAQAAVGNAKIEYWEISVDNPLDEIDSRYPRPFDKNLRERIKECLNNSREVLYKVLALNRNLNPRVQGTVFLRLVELSLLQKLSWADAHHYYDQYQAISPAIEHDYCRRWAKELEAKLTIAKNSFTITITPGDRFDRGKLDQRIEKYYSMFAVNWAAREIGSDAANDRINHRDSLSSYICNALHNNFGIAKTTADKWIAKYDLFAHLKSICNAAESLPEKARQARASKTRNQ
jgi:hypothetical protein